MKKIYFLSLFAISYLSLYCQVDWTKLPEPVLEKGAPGSWESMGIGFPAVVFDDTIYHMWYGGISESGVAIGHATSPDGLTWTKDPNNPVPSPLLVLLHPDSSHVRLSN